MTADWTVPHNKTKGGWSDDDARTFMIFGKTAVVSKGSRTMHRELLQCLSTAYFAQEFEWSLIEGGFVCTDEGKLAEILAPASQEPIAVWMRDHKDDITGWGDLAMSTDGDNAVDSQGVTIASGKLPFRSIEGTLTGRLWLNKQVISFWNDHKEVKQGWNDIIHMFDHAPESFGDWEDYSIDWIERTSNEDTFPMGRMSEVARQLGKQADKVDPKKEKSVDAVGQKNFVARLFATSDKIKTLDPAQLKAIREKMHVLDPQVKGELMKLSKQYKNKAAEIAEALGMSVAEFHHLYHIDEKQTHGPTL
jgi:hypothetical protein